MGSCNLEWMEMCGRTLLRLRTLKPQILKGLSQLFPLREEVLSLPSAEGALSPPEILPLIGEMSAGPAVTFSEGEARQDNTDVSCGLNRNTAHRLMYLIRRCALIGVDVALVSVGFEISNAQARPKVTFSSCCLLIRM